MESMPRYTAAAADGGGVGNKKTRRVLVTGATGFLGRTVVRFLIDREYQVTGTGRNMEEGEKLVGIGAIFSVADITNKQDICRLCKNQNIVIHCAALCRPWGRYIDHEAVNLNGTKNVIAGCLENLSTVELLVNISSPSVLFNVDDYSRNLRVIGNDTRLADPARVANNYIRTKLEALH